MKFTLNSLQLNRVSAKAQRVIAALVLLPLLVASAAAQFTGPDKQYQNKTAVADTLTEKLLMQRQAIRAGTDPQALEGAIDPSKYVLGPGDGVYLNVYAAHFLDQDLTVTPEGKLIVPRTGEISISGLTVTEAEAKVNKLLARDYKTPDAHLALRRLKSIKVSVLGEVLQPGIQTVTSLMRVSEVIAKAGDLKEKSALRNIEIRRPDGSLRTTADLLKYYETGDVSTNPSVEGGDVIIVRKVTKYFTVSGAIAKPGIYEFAPGDKISTALEIGGSPLPSAQMDSIEVASFTNSPDRATRRIVNLISGQDEELHEGDVISVRGYSQYHVPRVVSVGGEVTYPGKYSIELGQTRILDVIGRAGGILPTGSLDEAVVLRRAGIGAWESDPEFIMLERMKGTTEEKRITDDQFNYYMARSRQLGRSIMVVNFKELIEKNDQSQNILLRDQDSIWVPRARGFVSVLGTVVNPGNITYIEGMNYEDYIMRAGGYTSSSDESGVRVINAKTGSYINPSSDSHYQIGPGDTIVIPAERPTFWENFQLVTAITAQVITIIAGVVLLAK